MGDRGWAGRLLNWSWRDGRLEAEVSVGRYVVQGAWA